MKKKVDLIELPEHVRHDIIDLTPDVPDVGGITQIEQPINNTYFYFCVIEDKKLKKKIIKITRRLKKKYGHHRKSKKQSKKFR